MAIGRAAARSVRRLRLIVLGLALGAASTLAAEPLRFEQVSVAEGLSQSTVRALVQDRYGFLWIGTLDGLNRYDGYEFVVYRQELTHKSVEALYEDRDGRLWVGTEGGGLLAFDTSALTFTPFRHRADDAASLPADWVKCLAGDDAGFLWVGTVEGLARVDPTNGTVRRVDLAAPGEAEPSIQALAVDGDALLVGTAEGLVVLDTATLSVQRRLTAPQPLGNADIGALLVDSRGGLWIGTVDGIDYRAAADEWVHFGSDPSDPGSLSGPEVRCLYETRDGTVWVGVWGGGLDRYDPETRTFTSFRRDPADPTSLSSDNVTHMLEDSSGVRWVGTWEGGLNRNDPFAPAFHAYRNDPTDSDSLSGHSVNFVHQEGDLLWVGTWGGGLQVLDRSGGPTRRFRHRDGDPTSLSHDRLYALAEDADGKFWIGTQDGVSIFDPGNGTSRHLAAGAQGLSGPVVRSVLIDSGGAVWLGTDASGLDRVDPESGRVDWYRHRESDPDSLGNDRVLALLEDREGRIWAGTFGGVDRYDPVSGGFEHWTADPQVPDSLADPHVFSLLEDRGGNLWVGTKSGLHRLLPEGGFERFTQADGLPNDVIYGILEDATGQLWLSTNAGLSRFDPRTRTFRNFGLRYGLQALEFNSGACDVGELGELFFGGVEGFTAFLPYRMWRNPYPPRLVLTRFLLANRSMAPRSQDPDSPLEAAPWATHRIVLDWRHYLLQFEFSAIHSSDPAKNLYRHRLEGLDRDWIETTADKRFATYTNLAPGHYTFRVEAANADGVWSRDGLAVELTMRPPIWRTWWAYALYVLGSAAALVLGALTLRRRAEDERQRLAAVNRMLEDQVAERTRELESANRSLHELSLTDSLTGLHNRRFLLGRLEEEVTLRRGDAQQQVGSCTAYLVDLDHFKAVNDRFGHAEGDHVLGEAAQILRREFRASDLVVRWGGEEFLVLVLTAEGDPSLLAERLRRAFEEHRFAIRGGRRAAAGGSVAVTASIGFLSTRSDVFWGRRLEEHLELADTFLYCAKASGRNGWVGATVATETDLDRALDLLHHHRDRLLASARLRLLSSFEEIRLGSGRHGEALDSRPDGAAG